MKRYIIAILVVLLVAILFHVLNTHVHKKDTYKMPVKKIMIRS